MAVSNLDAIKEAIAELPSDEKLSLAAWLNLQDCDDWDREMMRDFSAGGAGHRLVDAVKTDIRAGKYSPMPDAGNASE